MDKSKGDKHMKFLDKIRKGHKGFTLIELLVVIAILGVLAAVAVPNIVNFIDKGKAGAANAELGMANTGIQAAMAANGVSTVTAGTLSASSDLTPAVTAYIQGGYTTLKGSYTVNANGRITAATYPGIANASGFPLAFH